MILILGVMILLSMTISCGYQRSGAEYDNLDLSYIADTKKSRLKDTNKNICVMLEKIQKEDGIAAMEFYTRSEGTASLGENAYFETCRCYIDDVLIHEKRIGMEETENLKESFMMLRTEHAAFEDLDGVRMRIEFENLVSESGAVYEGVWDLNWTMKVLEEADTYYLKENAYDGFTVDFVRVTQDTLSVHATSKTVLRNISQAMLLLEVAQVEYKNGAHSNLKEISYVLSEDGKKSFCPGHSKILSQIRNYYQSHWQMTEKRIFSWKIRRIKRRIENMKERRMLMKKKNNRLMKIAIGMSILAVCTVLLAAGLFMAKRMEEEHATPQEVLNAYFALIPEKKYEEMYGFLSAAAKENISKEAFMERNQNIYDGIECSEIKIEISEEDSVVEEGAKEAELVYKTTMQTLAGEALFGNSAVLTLDEEKEYKIEWTSRMIFPDLGEKEKVKIRTKDTRRGSILDRNGKILAQNGAVSEVGLVPGKMPEDPTQMLSKLASLLDTEAEKINKELSASWVTDETFVPLKRISRENEELEKNYSLAKAC